MARPTSKTDLMQAAAANLQKLNDFVAGMTEAELSTPFDFSADEKKKEAHWRRDKNLRDVLIHLWEWHQLLLKWVQANQAGEERPFLPAPYNWKTYGQMNQEFWERHQSTSLAEAQAMLAQSHAAVLALAEEFSNEQLFSKGVFKWAGNNALGSYFVSVTASHYDWALKKLKVHRKNCAVG